MTKRNIKRNYLLAAVVVVLLFHFNYYMGLGAYIILMIYGLLLYYKKGVPAKPKKKRYVFVRQDEEENQIA